MTERQAENGRSIVAPNRRNDKELAVGYWQTECCARLLYLYASHKVRGKVTCRRVFGAGDLGTCIPAGTSQEVA